jgi:hypothetical protein
LDFGSISATKVFFAGPSNRPQMDDPPSLSGDSGPMGSPV